MAKPELLHSISILSKQIDNLLEQQQLLQKKIEDLENLNLKLSKQHEEDLVLLDKANKDIEFLSVSYRLASSPEALISARNKVSQLIRTIDNCIRIINED